MDTDAVIGIDLGTTNSEVAIIRNGRPEIVREDDEAMVPSCVGVDEDGGITRRASGSQPVDRGT